MASVSIYLFYFFTKETPVVLYSFTLAKEVNIQIFKKFSEILVIRIIVCPGNLNADIQDVH